MSPAFSEAKRDPEGFGRRGRFIYSLMILVFLVLMIEAVMVTALGKEFGTGVAEVALWLTIVIDVILAMIVYWILRSAARMKRTINFQRVHYRPFTFGWMFFMTVVLLGMPAIAVIPPFLWAEGYPLLLKVFGRCFGLLIWSGAVLIAWLAVKANSHNGSS